MFSPEKFLKNDRIVVISGVEIKKKKNTGKKLYNLLVLIIQFIME